MRKTLVKILSFLLVITAFVPVMFLVGCKGGETAKNVRNRTYVITSALKDKQVVQKYLDNNFRIIFGDNHFKVEYGADESAKNYGYYNGTYKADRETVTFTIENYGGAFSEDTIEKPLVLSKLEYRKGVLSIEFIDGQYMYQFEFSVKK